MSTRTRRRPSLPVILSSAALFVALGGPAEAARLLDGKRIRSNTVTSKQIKNGTVTLRDIQRRTREALLAVPADGVDGTRVRDGSLTGADLAPGSVGGDRLGSGIPGNRLVPGSVDSPSLRDGGVLPVDLAKGRLGAEEIGRFAGDLRLTFPEPIPAGGCRTATSTTLTPVTAGEGQDLRDDVILVTPSPNLPGSLVLEPRAAGPDQIQLTICNLSGQSLTLTGERTFRYVTIDSTNTP